MNIKFRVLNLIAKYNTKNPFKLSKKLSIEIIFEDLGDTKGFYKKILRNKFIFINSELTEFEQKLVCAHELGHAILHSTRRFEFLIDNTRILRDTKIENEANEFASWLIFGDDEDLLHNQELENAYCKNINSWIIDDIVSMRKKKI